MRRVTKLGWNGTRVQSYWKGVQGVFWKLLVPELHQLKQKWPSPDMLIIHTKDVMIERRNMEGLLGSIKKVLTSIHNLFPQCMMVWSDILPKYSKLQGFKPVVVDKSLRNVVNDKVHVMVAKLGGTFVTHENIGPYHYRRKGGRLTADGVKTFKINIQEFANRWVKDVSQASEHLQISSSTTKVNKPLYSHL